jgi:hypothetical protein
MRQTSNALQQIGIKKYENLTKRERAFYLLVNFDTMYYIVFMVVAIIAIFKPFWYCFLLLDIIKRSDALKNILKAITMSAYQLVLTLLLGVIFIYIFSAIAFSKFAKYYQNSEQYGDDVYDAQQNSYCDSLKDCFFSTLNLGVRNGGGIGDAIRSPLMTEDYASRFWFDMVFFIAVIIILLNIIFGIIIDNFAVLRDKRTDQLEKIQTKCLICQKDRSKLQLHGKGWVHHFMSEHSPFAYLAFLVYINDKDIYDCNGLEKFVKECWEIGSAEFLPDDS